MKIYMTKCIYEGKKVSFGVNPYWFIHLTVHIYKIQSTDISVINNN